MGQFAFIVPDDKVVGYIIQNLKREGEAYIMHCGKVLEFVYDSATKEVEFSIDCVFQRTLQHDWEIEELIKELEEQANNKLSDESWIIEFIDRDNKLVEEQHYSSKAAAFEAFGHFRSPENGELYSRIDLIECNWVRRSEIILQNILFPEGGNE